MAQCLKTILKPAHELGQRQLKPQSEDLQGAEARLLLASLQIGNEGPAQTRVNSKVRLGPAPFVPEPSNTLPESQADIFSCHAISMAVFFGLHFAYRIQSSRADNTGHVCQQSWAYTRFLANSMISLSLAEVSPWR